MYTFKQKNVQCIQSSVYFHQYMCSLGLKLMNTSCVKLQSYKLCDVIVSLYVLQGGC